MLAGSAVFALHPPVMAFQIAFLAGLVAVLGLPHGALDLEVARALWPLRTRRAVTGFVVAYLGFVGAMLLFWFLAPGAALAAFLAYSAVHFSDDWRDEWPRAARLAAGVIVVGAPLLLRGDEAAVILAHLAPEGAAAMIVQVGGIAALIAIAVLIWQAARIVRNGWSRAGLAEIAAVLLGAWALPPLIYFVLYFCLLHSLRHFGCTARRLNLTWTDAMRIAAPITAVTLGGAALAWLLLLNRGAMLEGATLSVVFVSLAVLTVPHMILVDRFHQQVA